MDRRTITQLRQVVDAEKAAERGTKPAPTTDPKATGSSELATVRGVPGQINRLRHATTGAATPTIAGSMTVHHRAHEHAANTIGQLQHWLDVQNLGAPGEFTELLKISPFTPVEGREDDVHRLWYLLSTGCWAALVGDPGTGKTFTAWQIAWWWRMVHRTGQRVIPLPTLIDKLQQGCYGDEAQSIDAAIGVFVRPELLVLDECDKIIPTADTCRWLFRLLHARHEKSPRRGATLFISNDSAESFRTRWDAHLRDRIMGKPRFDSDVRGAYIEWLGESLRRQGATS